MNLMHYLLPVLLSGLTGWLVVWVLTSLLFKPIDPINIGGFTWQGILPARKTELAKKIGKLAGTEIMNLGSLETKLTDPGNFEKLKPEIENHIDSFLRERLKDTFPMLAMMIGDKTINQLKNAFLLELETLFPMLIKSYIRNLDQNLDVEETITQRIAEIPDQKLEAMFRRAAGRQLMKLKAAGALVGIVMGFLHIFINSKLFG